MAIATRVTACDPAHGMDECVSDEVATERASVHPISSLGAGFANECVVADEIVGQCDIKSL